MTPFSPKLQHKINILASRRQKIKLGSIPFESPLLLAPMASICDAPFRLLMQDLGAGGSVSELISADGIFYKNKKTQDMLTIFPEEKNIGLQLFGDEAEKLAYACEVAASHNPSFVDLNLGCPVKKVVQKGSGSALLRKPKELEILLLAMKQALGPMPLTIKIRLGWDDSEINADEIAKLAYDCGVEFVAVHGRTREQQYSGLANWDYLEGLAKMAPLPIIGNGDLHHEELVRNRLQKTNCDALMLARGPLRSPFLFLESYKKNLHEKTLTGESLSFHASDYVEIIQRYFHYLTRSSSNENYLQIQLRKMIVWYSSGLKNSVQFRSKVFTTQNLSELMEMTQEFFSSLGETEKRFDEKPFMTSGHG